MPLDFEYNCIYYIETGGKRRLIGKEYEVKLGLEKYIRTYKKASIRRDVPRNDMLCRFSTLQYFEEYI